MQSIFNTLIDSFIENKIGIAEGFLNDTLASNLRENLLELYRDDQLLAAGTGNAANINFNKLTRSDIIYWLDRKHYNIHENSFFDLMDDFISHLNETCYTSITGCEFHYTLYEKGSYYKKHIDQFKNNQSRQFSVIMYLNKDWQEKDGGELCIHQNNKKQNISPANGKIVFFKSNELEHEVLITHKPRMSITGWLKS